MDSRIKMKKILVADDVDTTRMMLKIYLGKKGYEVIEAKDGFEAITVALNELPDLIFLDIKMPNMDGIEVTRRLRLEESTKDIPIFIISGYDRMQDAFSEEKGTKIEGFIGKPFRMEILLEKIRKLED